MAYLVAVVAVVAVAYLAAAYPVAVDLEAVAGVVAVAGVGQYFAESVAQLGVAAVGQTSAPCVLGYGFCELCRLPPPIPA